MRCYFMRDGHFAAVELLDVKSDEEAVEKCRGLLEERKPLTVPSRTRRGCGRLVRAQVGGALRFRQPQDDVAVALAGAPERARDRGSPHGPDPGPRPP
jgi:hypothetical protein